MPAIEAFRRAREPIAARRRQPPVAQAGVVRGVLRAVALPLLERLDPTGDPAGRRDRMAHVECNDPGVGAIDHEEVAIGEEVELLRSRSPERDRLAGGGVQQHGPVARDGRRPGAGGVGGQQRDVGCEHADQPRRRRKAGGHVERQHPRTGGGEQRQPVAGEGEGRQTLTGGGNGFHLARRQIDTLEPTAGNGPGLAVTGPQCQRFEGADLVESPPSRILVALDQDCAVRVGRDVAVEAAREDEPAAGRILGDEASRREAGDERVLAGRRSRLHVERAQEEPVRLDAAGHDRAVVEEPRPPLTTGDTACPVARSTTWLVIESTGPATRTRREPSGLTPGGRMPVRAHRFEGDPGALQRIAAVKGNERGPS